MLVCHRSNISVLYWIAMIFSTYIIVPLIINLNNCYDPLSFLASSSGPTFKLSNILNITVLTLSLYVTMLTLTFSSKHCCASLQPHRAAKNSMGIAEDLTSHT